MAIKYAKADAAGDNDGDTLEDAYTDLQTAIDSTTAGNTLKVCKSASGAGFSPAAQVDLDTNDTVEIIGCDASGNELPDFDWVDIDGTTGSIADLFHVNGRTSVKVRRLHFTGYSDAGVYYNTANSFYCQFDLCKFTGGVRGVEDLNRGYDCYVTRSIFIGQTSYHCWFNQKGAAKHCIGFNGGADGFACYNQNPSSDLIAVNSTGAGIRLTGTGASIKNFTCFGCGTGVIIAAADATAMNGRIISCTTGFNFGTQRHAIIDCAYHNVTTLKSGTGGELEINLVELSAAGLVNPGAGNYMLSATAEQRNFKTVMDSLNSSYGAMGVVAEEVAGGGAQLGAFETGAWR